MKWAKIRVDLISQKKFFKKIDIDFCLQIRHLGPVGALGVLNTQKRIQKCTSCELTLAN